MKTGSPAAKILIVDDNDDLLFLMGARLQSNGYEVVTARNGEIAIKMALQEKPDLILLDLGLPILDGFEVCRWMKSDPATCKIPIIVLSAKSQQADKVQAEGIGVAGYLAKPCAPEVLMKKIKTLLEGGEAHVC